MQAYLDIVKKVLEEGTRKPSRTGIDTISYFGLQFRHDLADGFPLLTTKDMSGPLWNSIVHELLWFLSGENHIRNLREKTKIWNAWADENGELDTCYGWYWRNFAHTGGRMEDYRNPMAALCTPDADPGNFDQIKRCIQELKENPTSRRMVVSAWEPMNAWNSKLPPCHYTFVFNVQDDRLCLHWTMRSADLGVGYCFNIASYALLCHIIAQQVNLKPGTIVGSIVDAHIYSADIGDKTPILANTQTREYVPRSEFDHVRAMKQQLKRKPYSLPQIKIAHKHIDQFSFDDFELIGYKCHPRIKMRVAV